MLKMKLSYYDQSDWVSSMIKIKLDNNVIACTGVVYTKNDTKLLWPIGSSANCDENQIRQLRDWSYKCGLRWKQTWVVMINQTGYDLWKKPNGTTMWLIMQVLPTLKLKFNYRDLFYWVWSMIKTRKDNNVTNCTGMVYTKNEIELYKPIRPIFICEENQIGLQRNRSYRCGLLQKWY